MKTGTFAKSYLLAAATTLLLSGSALSADWSGETYVEDASFDWSGFYAGVSVGYGSTGSSATNGINTFSIASNGLLAGVDAGFNAQFDQFVLGVEGDILWSGQTGMIVIGAQTDTVTYDWVGSLKARAGVAVGDALLFATVGVSATQANITVTPPSGGTTGSFGSILIGASIGGGVEYAVSENLTLKTEYTYTAFGDISTTAGSISNSVYAVNTHSHAVKVGMNYHF